MSRKRSESPVLAVIEGLSEGPQEDIGPTCPVETVRDEHNVHSELAYIGQKTAAVAGKIAASLEREMNGKGMLELIQDLELARFSARKLVDAAALPAAEHQAVKEVQLKDIQVSGKSGNVLLKLTLLPLTPYPIKGAYNVYFGVKEALLSYGKKQPFQFDPSCRYTLIYQRIVKGKVRLSAGCCDNDNFEMQRVTNAITEVIGIADSADKFSFYYTTMGGREAKTLVYLVLENDLPELLNDNQFKNPD